MVPVLGGFTIDVSYTPGFGLGGQAKEVAPHLAMATHLSYNHALLGGAIAEVRVHYEGMIAFGIVHQVVNVTKDCHAALPETTKPSSQWLIETTFGRVVHEEIVLPAPHRTIATVQEMSVRDRDTKTEKFTPLEMNRPSVQEWPNDRTIQPTLAMGGSPAGKSYVTFD